MELDRGKVLFTGASSFTGATFASALVSRGFAVVAPIRRTLREYEGMRFARLSGLPDKVSLVANAPVGSRMFTKTLTESGRFDAVVLHHAQVSGYRSADFDVGGAILDSTANAAETAKLLAKSGCRAAILTRSVFEAGQGLGSRDGPIGLYAVAKTATVETWRFHLEREGIPCTDFTIANPVGPDEERRLVAYLASAWASGGVPALRAPQLVRDNVPVDLLGEAFAHELELAIDGRGSSLVPSFWVGSNLDFATKVASEFASRLHTECQVTTERPFEDSEPVIRIGKDRLTPRAGWDESIFWDRYVGFYRSMFD